MAATPGSILHIEKFNGTNYSTWAQSAELLLMHQGLHHCLKENVLTEVDRKDAAKVAKHELEEAKAFGSLGLAIDPFILQGISLPTKKAHSLWERLKTLYEPKTAMRVLQLKRQLRSIRKGDDESMQSYVNRFEACAKQLADINKPVDDEEAGWNLLMGLPASKETFLMGFTASLGTDKLTKSTVVQALLFEDSRTSNSSENTNNPIAMPAATSKTSSSKDAVCWSCHEKGHLSFSCPYSKPWSVDEKGTSSRGRGRFPGNRRGFRGKRSNSAKQQSSMVTGEDGVELLLTTAALGTFPASKDDIVLDCGSTRHMVAQLDWLHDKKTVPTEKILTADSRTLLETNVAGNVKIPSKCANLDLTLHDALFIKELPTNLVSASCAVEKGCKFWLDKEGCLILKDGKIIADGKLENGLFKLNCGKVRKLESAIVSTDTTKATNDSCVNNSRVSIVEQVMCKELKYLLQNSENVFAKIRDKEMSNVAQFSKVKNADTKRVIVNENLKKEICITSATVRKQYSETLGNC